jgi:hypothetical protein
VGSVRKDRSNEPILKIGTALAREIQEYGLGNAKSITPKTVSGLGSSIDVTKY